MGTFYLPGAHNKICDRTGFKVKSTDTRKEWNNLVVRRESFELRHPQDLIRSRPDRQQVPDPRSEPDNSFVGPNSVNVLNAVSTNTSGETISTAYKVPDGQNRILVVFLGVEETATLTDATSVTFGSSSLTLAAKVKQAGGTENQVEIWYLLNPSGQGTVTGTWSGQNINNSCLAVMTLTGAKQEAPTTATSAGTSSPISTQVTTTARNSLVLSGVSAGVPNDLTTNQTEVLEETAPSSALAVDKQTLLDPGVATHQWSQESVLRLAHAVAVFAPAFTAVEASSL